MMPDFIKNIGMGLLGILVLVGLMVAQKLMAILFVIALVIFIPYSIIWYIGKGIKKTYDFVKDPSKENKN